MDNPVVLYLLVLLVFVLLIARRVLNRYSSEKIAQKGRELGLNLGEQYAAKVKQHTKVAGRLGETLEFTSASTAGVLVRSVFQTHGGITATGPNQWDLKYANSSDMQISFVTHQNDSATLRVDRTVEMMGMPMGDIQWQRLLKKIEKQAASQGVTVTRSAGALVHSAQSTDAEPFWVRAD